jgi:hypothetical protein
LIFLVDYRDFLREDGNTLARVGAIAASSLAGVALGFRGGFFRKQLYALITGGAMAALCYPREAEVYARIAYNFAFGVKPGDEKMNEIAKFPSTLDELVGLTNKAYEALVKNIK